MISGINLDTKSVTVEWYENGETKGKEVRFILWSYFCGSFIVFFDELIYNHQKANHNMLKTV